MKNPFKKKPKKIFVTHDGFQLVEGKKYNWSGVVDNLYNCYSWKNFKCKITKVCKDKIYLYDYEDKIEYEYTNEHLRNLEAEFK